MQRGCSGPCRLVTLQVLPLTLRCGSLFLQGEDWEHEDVAAGDQPGRGLLARAVALPRGGRAVSRRPRAAPPPPPCLTNPARPSCLPFLPLPATDDDLDMGDNEDEEEGAGSPVRRWGAAAASAPCGMPLCNCSLRLPLGVTVPRPGDCMGGAWRGRQPTPPSLFTPDGPHDVHCTALVLCCRGVASDSDGEPGGAALQAEKAH